MPAADSYPPPPEEVRKTRLFAPFYTKNVIILPRQARDKQRESTQKRDGAFSADVPGQFANIIFMGAYPSLVVSTIYNITIYSVMLYAI